MRRRLVGTFSIGLCFALTACGKDAVVPPSTEGLRTSVLALTELTINDFAGPNMQATLRMLSDETAGTLVFTPSSASMTATPTQRFFSIRLLLAHPSLGRDPLILVPIADATTIEGTPFRTFLRRDGSPGRAERARLMVASPPMGIDGAGRLVTDSTAFLRLSDEDVAAVLRPAGVLSVFPYAFVVREFDDAPGEFDVRISYELPRADASEDPVTVSILLLVLKVEGSDPQITTRVRT